ncbi:MAG: DNA repair and recombination protein RadB [Nanoarchaeota archaeon]|jgi:DNA repair protein RadB|nr:DNA repair and recombination protein RadB [Nanoarchaeota archaeon]
MNRVSTGSFDLNDWLEGGYERGIVTMVAGPAGAGKTNFSVLAACSVAREKKVVFVDTEGGFSVERVRQIVGVGNFERILSNILLLSPTNFKEQKNAFERLREYLVGDEVGLLVVDSMAMLYRLEMGEAMVENRELVAEGREPTSEKASDVNRDIAKQMRSLVEIARKREIPVLITNQVYSSFLSADDLRDGKEKMTFIVGGDLFKYWSKCIIELKHSRGRKAILLKHRNLPEKSFYFEIKNEGIFKKSGLF